MHGAHAAPRRVKQRRSLFFRRSIKFPLRGGKRRRRRRRRRDDDGRRFFQYDEDKIRWSSPRLLKGEGRREFSSIDAWFSCRCSRRLSRICEDGRPRRRSGTSQCRPIACPGSWEIRRPTTPSITSFPAPRNRSKPSLSSKGSFWLSMTFFYFSRWSLKVKFERFH